MTVFTLQKEETGSQQRQDRMNRPGLVSIFFPVYFMSLFLKCGPWTSSFGQPGSLLEIQNLKQRPSESESAF